MIFERGGSKKENDITKWDGKIEKISHPLKFFLLFYNFLKNCR
jgi:hypothetical protein